MFNRNSKPGTLSNLADATVTPEQILKELQDMSFSENDPRLVDENIILVMKKAHAKRMRVEKLWMHEKTILHFLAELKNKIQLYIKSCPGHRFAIPVIIFTLLAYFYAPLRNSLIDAFHYKTSYAMKPDAHKEKPDAHQHFSLKKVIITDSTNVALKRIHSEHNIAPYSDDTFSKTTSNKNLDTLPKPDISQSKSGDFALNIRKTAANLRPTLHVQKSAQKRIPLSPLDIIEELSSTQSHYIAGVNSINPNNQTIKEDTTRHSTKVLYIFYTAKDSLRYKTIIYWNRTSKNPLLDQSSDMLIRLAQFCSQLLYSRQDSEQYLTRNEFSRSRVINLAEVFKKYVTSSLFTQEVDSSNEITLKNYRAAQYAIAHLTETDSQDSEVLLDVIGILQRQGSVSKSFQNKIFLCDWQRPIKNALGFQKELPINSTIRSYAMATTLSEQELTTFFSNIAVR